MLKLGKWRINCLWWIIRRGNLWQWSGWKVRNAKVWRIGVGRWKQSWDRLVRWDMCVKSRMGKLQGWSMIFSWGRSKRRNWRSNLWQKKGGILSWGRNWVSWRDSRLECSSRCRGLTHNWIVSRRIKLTNIHDWKKALYHWQDVSRRWTIRCKIYWTNVRHYKKSKIYLICRICDIMLEFTKLLTQAETSEQ